jgi:glyoxylase-like metal-dependent hydrolase (beta-lactamase superfamily II)
MNFDPQALPMTGAVQQIGAAVWRIVAPNPSPLTGPGTNTYVLGAARSVVIDPGSDDAGHLARILEVAGPGIDRILCTHSHPDHSPGAAWLRERPARARRRSPGPALRA